MPRAERIALAVAVTAAVAVCGACSDGGRSGVDDGVTTATSSTTPASQIQLGMVTAPNQEGYGTVAPRKIYNGGDPTGLVYDITWSNWGDVQAKGTGTALHVPAGGYVPDAKPERATVVAYNLGPCQGKTAYRAVTWFFPDRGEVFSPSGVDNMCAR